MKFTPEVPGAYSIEVKISGDTLANSAFTVTLKERELSVVDELDLNSIRRRTGRHSRWNCGKYEKEYCRN